MVETSEAKMRTEQIQVKKTKELSEICRNTNALYNRGLYLYRQLFFEKRDAREGIVRKRNTDEKYIEKFSYYELYDKLKDEECYKALPAQVAQQTLRLVAQNWTSFWAAWREHKVHPEKFLGEPRIPCYKKKDGEFVATFTNQSSRVKNGWLYFAKKSGLEPVKTRISEFQQVRIVPKGYYYVIEIVYKLKENNDARELDRNRIMAIDFGVNNLVTSVSNVPGVKSFVVKGGFVKSSNQFYNKVTAKLQSRNAKNKCKHRTLRLQRVLRKRNNQVKDYFHKTSEAVIDECVKNNLGTLVIGYNQKWKQNVNLGARNNQNFVQIPYYRLVRMLKYKADAVGIQVVMQEESYTSKCSFLDGESIEHHVVYKGERISRGLFRASNGQLINADVNGALNILKKAFPNAFAEGIVGLVLVPFSLRLHERRNQRNKIQN